MEVRKMVCVSCPLGCSLEVRLGEDVEVTGNKCKRGREYALSEVINPKRIITSTVSVKDGDRRLVSVKTDKEIPKKLIFEVMKEINKLVITAPVAVGDILIKGVLGTEADIIATSSVHSRQQ